MLEYFIFRNIYKERIMVRSSRFLILRSVVQLVLRPHGDEQTNYIHTKSAQGSPVTVTPHLLHDHNFTPSVDTFFNRLHIHTYIDSDTLELRPFER